MSSELQTGKLNQRISSLNPWALILFIFPIPLIIFAVFFYYWSVTRDTYKRVTTQFIQRQNKVLARDAMEIAREVSHLLEESAHDIQALSMIPPSYQHFTQFYLSRVGQLTQLDPRDDSINLIPLPLYSEIIYFNSRGDELWHLHNGQRANKLHHFSQCSAVELCDSQSLKKTISLPVGELYFGKLMRFYAKQSEKEQVEGAYLPVFYRTEEGVFLLGLDYRYLGELLAQPTFPYERKNNLLRSYQNGNYIFLVDSDLDLLAHPKYWNVEGIDRKTGLRARPMELDSDEGSHPLNVRAYRGEKLRPYFDRLLNRSFLQKSVDIFKAFNLAGSSRVLSVAPILLNKGQFQKNGVFGFVILGCSVDYFEEPKDQYVPYY
jgi:hypothetical protein